LSAAGLPVVETSLLSDFMPVNSGPWVLKPKDGVGCQGGRFVTDTQTLAALQAGMENQQDMLVQPYCAGQAVSLSCLFKDSKAWLLCCNQQKVKIVANRFVLQACVVNMANPRRDFYLQLIEKVAVALPALWGYVGIDLIETQHNGPLLLEINPRLTTSYVGIEAATGINVAEQVLALIEAEPSLQSSRNTPVTVTIL
jgi:predicted ATP-grasp superfamily ATP-dependent carboligase